MSEFKGTPGPWIYSKDERYFPRVEFPAARLDGRYLTVNEPTGEVMGVYEANAYLISAAPDYHDAAVKIVAEHDEEAKRVNFKRCGCDTCKALRPIIAKATGETP